jgi:hypothetical protein
MLACLANIWPSEADLGGSTVELRPHGRAMSAIAEVVLLAIWTYGIVSFVRGYRAREGNAALLSAVTIVMTLGAAVLVFLLLWTALGMTVIEVNDSRLAREFKVGPIRMGLRREFDRRRIKNIRASTYTVRRRSGFVTRYAIDFDYDGEVVRLFHDRVPERVNGLLEGSLKPLTEEVH